VITSGLLAFVRSPDELAWVLAHEVGHHALEHSKRAKLQDVLNRFFWLRLSVRRLKNSHN
jgi:Zn-dependent protease with chaperone function